MVDAPVRQEKQEASSEVTEVAPDIIRIQLPVNVPGLRHVNTYGLIDDRGIALVDPGMPGRGSYRTLKSRLASAGFKISDVHTVLVTHSHPDHFGGAPVLQAKAGAQLVSHRFFRTWFDFNDGGEIDDDDLSAEAWRVETPEGEMLDASLPPWQRERPWGGGQARPPLRASLAIRAARLVGPSYVRAPKPTRRVDDADVLELAGREWVAVHTPGHTVDHLCLYSPADGIVLSGDHVLPTITPHISGLAAGVDPLNAFFESLARMAGLEGTGLVLPAHGHPFDDLGGRCGSIRHHHEERLDKLRRAALETGEADVVELSHHLFQQRSWGPMAESETYAHLEHLRRAGEMSVRRVDGLLRYSLDPQVAETLQE